MTCAKFKFGDKVTWGNIKGWILDDLIAENHAFKSDADTATLKLILQDNPIVTCEVTINSIEAFKLKRGWRPKE